MVKKLSLNDFRARRSYLEASDFGHISNESESFPRIQLAPIDKDNWNHITQLSDDVLLRTTNFFGNQINRLCKVSGFWGEQSLVLIEDNDLNKEEYNKLSYFLFVQDEIEAFIFLLLHGWYRQAVSCLRVILEYTVKFISGLDIDSYQKIKSILNNKKNGSLFGNLSSVFMRIYKNASSFCHAVKGNSNSNLWKSNGPVASSSIFLKIYKYMLVINILLIHILNNNKVINENENFDFSKLIFIYDKVKKENFLEIIDILGLEDLTNDLIGSIVTDELD